MSAADGFMYSATCNNGPLHGKPLHHPEERFEMFKREGRMISYHRQPGAPLPPDIEVGAYVFNDGRWEWTRDDVS